MVDESRITATARTIASQRLTSVVVAPIKTQIFRGGQRRRRVQFVSIHHYWDNNTLAKFWRGFWINHTSSKKSSQPEGTDI
jgi:hypothetical protein